MSEQRMSKTPQDKPDVSAIHRETGLAWDIVASTGYMKDIEEDVRFLKAGGITLMETEQLLLSDLSMWCDRACHLLCSGGKDLLSLWNMGAKELVGVDISPTLIDYAGQKSRALGAPATWYCCDVLETPHELDGSCDLVFTGRGAMMWIMDLGAWARVVERLLKPGGRFFLFEGHPLDNVWDREASEFILRSDGMGYFEEAPAENPGFPSSVIVRNLGNENRPRMLERCWRPGEVINALAGRGLQYAHFDEYPSLFWNQFERIPKTLSSRLPHAYSILMRKPGAYGNGEGTIS